MFVGREQTILSAGGIGRAGRAVLTSLLIVF